MQNLDSAILNDDISRFQTTHMPGQELQQPDIQKAQQLGLGGLVGQQPTFTPSDASIQWNHPEDGRPVVQGPDHTVFLGDAKYQQAQKQQQLMQDAIRGLSSEDPATKTAAAGYLSMASPNFDVAPFLQKQPAGPQLTGNEGYAYQQYLQGHPGTDFNTFHDQYDKLGYHPPSVNSNFNFTPEGLSLLGSLVNNGAPLPQGRPQIIGPAINEAAKQAGAAGSSSANAAQSIMGNVAQYQADKNSLKNATKVNDSIRGFSKVADDNLKVFTDRYAALGDNGSRLLNTPIRSFDDKILGDSNVRAMMAARQVALREVARVVNNLGNAGALTDDSRHETMDLLDKAETLPAFFEVLKVVKSDMANVENRMNENVNTINQRIKNGYAAPPPPAEGVTPPTNKGGWQVINGVLTHVGG